MSLRAPLFLVICVAVVSWPVAALAEGKPPNIVVMLSDTTKIRW